MNETAKSASDQAPRLQVRAMEGVTACDVPFRTYDVLPYIQVFVLLEGEQRFRLDDKLFELDAGAGPVAGVVCIARPSTLTFIAGPNVMMRKIKVIAPIDWVRTLADGADGGVAELRQFFSLHLSHHIFSPSVYLVQLAEQILRPPPTMRGELLTLYRQSRGLEVMNQVCRSLVESCAGRRTKAITAAARQSERVCDYILSHLTDMLAIDQIADHAGASVSTVQRHFKEHFGMTVFEFIRRKRLEAARDALEREGMTVTQAAYVAGYAHTSNFTAAFKKFYGITPGLRRG